MMSNVPPYFYEKTNYKQCPDCGNIYHLSEGGCTCEKQYIPYDPLETSLSNLIDSLNGLSILDRLEICAEYKREHQDNYETLDDQLRLFLQKI